MAIPADTHDSKPTRAPKNEHDSADTHDSKPTKAPEGTALFRNPSQDNVSFTLRDEGNRPYRVTCPPGRTCVVPYEYDEVVKLRAPQLVLVGKTPRALAPQE